MAKSWFRNVIKTCAVLGLAGAVLLSAGSAVYAQVSEAAVVDAVAVSDVGAVAVTAPVSEELASGDDDDDQSAVAVESDVEGADGEIVSEGVVSEPEVAASEPVFIADSNLVLPEFTEATANDTLTLTEIAISDELGGATDPVKDREEIAVSDEVSAKTGTDTGDPRTEIAVSGEFSFTTKASSEIAVSDEFSFTTERDGGDGGSGGGGGGGGSRRRTSAPREVLGAVTPCGEYLFKYIRYGWDNDPVEVAKLQYFLRAYEGFEVPISGVYDEVTLTAVMMFQRRYANDVLEPWGLTEMQPTGFVFITTRMAINNLFCRRSTDHDLDLRNIYDNWQYGAPGVVSKEGAGTYTDSDNTFSTTTWEYVPEATTGAFHGAALGLLDFLTRYGDIIFILLLLAVVIVMSYLLWHSYRKRQELADQYYNYPMVVDKSAEPTEEVRVRDDEISAADLREADASDQSADKSGQKPDKK